MLRALDTVEDDMAIPNDVKVPELLAFHEKCTDESFTMSCGEKDYKELMERYPCVVRVFKALKPHYQAVIKDLCKRMGEGMAEFAVKDGDVPSIAEYDEYCHYVAGLVGIGLSDLFSASGLEDGEVAKRTQLANSMGLFLQKTNIIRDYLEDIEEEPRPRMWWPKEVWGEYADGSLEEFKLAERPQNEDKAVAALNHMIMDALRHAPDALEYMGQLRDASVFRFCAIPQVMAAGTLALCFNNAQVFRGVVKMRRGATSKLMLEQRTLADVCRAFNRSMADIAAKVDVKAPNAQEILAAVEKVEAACDKRLKEAGADSARRDDDEPSPVWARVLLWLLFAGYAAYAFGLAGVRSDGVVGGSLAIDNAQKLFAVVCMGIITVVAFVGDGKLLA